MKKIGIIEDNPNESALLVEFLKKRNFEVQLAEDGEEGWEMVRTDPPDLLILDISLPKMDGWKILAKLRGDPNLKDIPVIIATAHNMMVNPKVMKKMGGDALLIKPLIHSQLLAKILFFLKKNGK